MVDENLINKCLVETHKHTKTVRNNLDIFIKELLDRGQHHDDSKFVEPELSGFAENTYKLSKAEYGTQEYRDLLTELKPTIEHHYSKNRHHSEHWPNGINDMDLVDILEMLCDWKAATERVKNGNLRKSLEINAERYEIGTQLRRILENTVNNFFKV